MSSHTAVRAYIALGSNLESPEQQVRDAFVALGRLPQTSLIAASSLYRTAPVGFVDQPDFINAVACVETRLGARDLLQSLLEIEHDCGRVRSFRNAPRTLDLDLLLYGDVMLHEEGLTLPHPRMQERAFVLVPLLEIAPECIIPGQGKAVDCINKIDATGIARVA